MMSLGSSDTTVVKNYIGLSCTGHDNALAIVDSKGAIVFAEATERYLQNKRALDAPPDDMFQIVPLIREYCESEAELVLCKTWSDAAGDVIARGIEGAGRSIAALATQQASATSERTRAALRFAAGRDYAFLQIADMHSHVRTMAGRNLLYHFRERVRSVRSYEHHLTHAAAACFTSPFSEALCVVVDGIGEGVSATCYRYDRGRLTQIGTRDAETAEPLAGLGLFYVDLCTLCGFDHWRGEEWKVMGLAGYGRDTPHLRRTVAQCLQVHGLGFRRPAGELAALARLIRDSTSRDDARATIADLACAGQGVFEDLLIELCRRIRELDPSENLVLSGGCALNSSANGKLLAATGFRHLYVPCAPADDGNAVGAALLAYFEDHPDERPLPGFQSPYLGSSMSRETLERVAQRSGFRRVERLANADLSNVVARRLCAGDLVGWVQGRAEFGPRALGNRSILADPRRPEMKDKVNEAVKFREGFRPFAPAVLAEHAEHWFEGYQETPYMERALCFRSDVRRRVPAVVHVDGTGRLQTVRREWNPKFHRLLTAFHEQSGVPMLLNTSFNVMGKPMVHSVQDAIATFATTGLDVLAIEDYLFMKD